MEAFRATLSAAERMPTTDAVLFLLGSLHFGWAEAAEGAKEWGLAEVQYQHSAAHWGVGHSIGAMPALLRWERLVRADAAR
jgi:hypothetical protein